jgi:hypothetical protein
LQALRSLSLLFHQAAEIGHFRPGEGPPG